MLRSINLVVIHCSATPSGKPISSGKATAANVIDRWHKERGFRRNAHAAALFNSELAHIGYHYVIEVTGVVCTGRSLDEVGAHAANFNAQSVGICMVGGIEREGRYTPAQWKALKTLVVGLMLELHVPLAKPLRVNDERAPGGVRVVGGICGHRDLSPDQDGDGQVEPGEWLKTCPGFDVAAWLENALQPLPGHIFQGAPA